MKKVVHILLVLAFLLPSTALASAAKKHKSKSPAEDVKKTAAEVDTSVDKPKAPAEQNTVAPKIEPKSASAGKIVATVNGTNITEGKVDEILAPIMKQAAGRVPENMLPQFSQQKRKQIIHSLIVEELLSEQEKQNNIDVNQAELDGAINKQIAERNLSLDEFKSLLKAYGKTFGEYQQAIKKGLMFDKLIAIQFADKLPKPTQEQMKAYYNDNIQRFQKPEAIHAKHILIATAKDVNDPADSQKKAREKAEAILKKLKGGADFEELAKESSDCPSGKNGGDLGIQPKGSLVPEFEGAAYALKPGQISDIVQTSFGYHIIKLIEHIDANTTKFEDVKDEIEESLSGEGKKKIIMDYIQQIKAAADIKYTDESDKLETEISGTAPTPPSRKTEAAAQCDKNKSADKECKQPEKD